MHRGDVELTDLFQEFQDLARNATSEPEFKASLWAWVDGQRKSGPLAPFLSDVERFFPRLHGLMSWAEARDVVAKIERSGYLGRALAACERLEEVSGLSLDCAVILLAGLERPEGYSRFHRGRNTVHVALDHPSNLRYPDHLEIILAHELTHSLRDPNPEVLADRGGWTTMSHDEFVAHYPLREHLVSEALATAISEIAYPGRAPHRYIYLDSSDHDWCEAHRHQIVARITRALETGESYRIFYAPNVIAPGAPECSDYYLAFHLGRYALGLTPPGELLGMPSTEFFAKYWEPFLSEFLGSSTPTPAEVTGSAGPELGRAVGVDQVAPAVARFYQELLSTWNPGEVNGGSIDERFLETVRSAGLVYGDDPYDVSSYPLVLSSDDLDYLRWVTESTARLVERVVELYRSDPRVRRYFDLPRHLEELALLEPGYRPYVPVGRFDSYWNGRRVQFLELNTNGTAGIALADRLSELAAEVPELKPLIRRHGLARMQLRQRLLETLEAIWRRARPDSKGPDLVGILDWAGGPTATELTQLAEFFSKAGLTTAVVHPEQLTFENGSLRVGGQRLDLIYRRLTTTDIVERAPQLEPFFEACRAGSVVVVGSFPADVAHSKRVFAFLTDERWRTQFSMQERTLIDAHIPWTRILRSGRTIYRGQSGDLRELALEHRERLVLKPTESYEGRGVLLGLEASPDEWAGELERRLGGHHLVQEYVEPPQRILHLPQGAVTREHALFLHLGEYMLDGRLAGILARASLERVLNVDSSEHALPAFVIDPTLSNDPEPPP